MLFSKMEALLAACIVAMICITTDGVNQQSALMRQSHTYSLGTYGQHSMQYQSIDATTKVRSCLFSFLALCDPVQLYCKRLWCGSIISGCLRSRSMIYITQWFDSKLQYDYSFSSEHKWCYMSDNYCCFNILKTLMLPQVYILTPWSWLRLFPYYFHRLQKRRLFVSTASEETPINSGKICLFLRQMDMIHMRLTYWVMVRKYSIK